MWQPEKQGQGAEGAAVNCGWPSSSGSGPPKHLPSWAAQVASTELLQALSYHTDPPHLCRPHDSQLLQAEWLKGHGACCLADLHSATPGEQETDEWWMVAVEDREGGRI